MQSFLKILGWMANSADPDQTAPEGAVWSGSALFAYAILSYTLVYKILGHLPYTLLFVDHLCWWILTVHLYINDSTQRWCWSLFRLKKMTLSSQLQENHQSTSRNKLVLIGKRWNAMSKYTDSELQIRHLFFFFVFFYNRSIDIWAPSWLEVLNSLKTYLPLWSKFFI